MRSSLRPAERADLPAVSRLLSQSFKTGPHAPFLNPETMQWKYWALRGDWTEPRAWLLEKNGAVTAFAGLCPMVFGSGPEAVRGVHMIDWGAAPESPGAGLTLVKKLSEMFDFIVAIGGSDATLKVLPALGFTECAKSWIAARPIRPVRQILTHQKRDWKLAPRLIRNALMMRGAVVDLRGFRSRPISPAEIDPVWLQCKPDEARFSPRPPAFFEYLLRCPGARFSLHSIESADGSVRHGCFAIGFVSHQARIAGIWLKPNSLDKSDIAYALARKAGSAMRGAYEIVVTGCGEASAEAVSRAGFRRLGDKPVLMLNRTKRFAPGPDFQFQLIEDDEAWLDIGRTNYWT